MEVYNKSQRKVLLRFIKHNVEKNSIYSEQHPYLLCVAKTLKCKSASFLNLKGHEKINKKKTKLTYLTTPVYVITIKKVEIDGLKVEDGMLVTVNTMISIRGKAVLVYQEKKPIVIESPTELSSPRYKKEPGMILNEMIQKKKVLIAKTNVEELDDMFVAKTVISARPESKMDAFEIFEGVGETEKLAKRDAAEKAIQTSILLKLPLEKISIKITKYDPISELNEAALQNKIGVNYVFEDNKTTLTLTKKIGESTYFDTYIGKGDKKQSKIKAAEHALKKSGFLSRIVRGEKVEKLKKELESKENEDERLEAILELASYVPFDQYYDPRLLKEIKKAKYIPIEELEQLSNKELDKRQKLIEENIHSMVEKAQPKPRQVYYKVAVLKRKSPKKLSKSESESEVDLDSPNIILN